FYGSNTVLSLPGLHYHEYHGPDQDQHRNFVEPAVINMAAPVAIMLEVSQQFATIQVISDQHQHQCQLGMQPAARNTIPQPEPQAEDHGQHRARRHDAIVELTLHNLETLDTRLVFTHRMIDKQTRQIK